MLRVTTPEEVEAVAGLAREIWHAHFDPLVGRAQIEYMLGKFQSVAAIGEQIASGYEYYLVVVQGGPAGYFALVPRPGEARAQLSKIYLLPGMRGRGLGRRIMAFAEERCRALGIGTLWLTVNRRNSGPIAFYEHLGFRHTASAVLDIGQGFVMDDYLMEKPVPPRA